MNILNTLILIIRRSGRDIVKTETNKKSCKGYNFRFFGCGVAQLRSGLTIGYSVAQVAQA